MSLDPEIYLIEFEINELSLGEMFQKVYCLLSRLPEQKRTDCLLDIDHTVSIKQCKTVTFHEYSALKA